MSERTKGFWAMIGVCVVWGLSPIFYNALAGVPVIEVLIHRTLWSLLLFVLILAWQGRLAEFRRAMSGRYLGQLGNVGSSYSHLPRVRGLFCQPNALTILDGGSTSHRSLPTGWYSLEEWIAKPTEKRKCARVNGRARNRRARGCFTYLLRCDCAGSRTEQRRCSLQLSDQARPHGGAAEGHALRA